MPLAGEDLEQGAQGLLSEVEREEALGPLHPEEGLRVEERHRNQPPPASTERLEEAPLAFRDAAPSETVGLVIRHLLLKV